MDKVCSIDAQHVLINDDPLNSMLDLLEDFMELRSIPYARLDGSTTRPRRNLDIRLVRVNHIARYLPLPSLLVSTRYIP